ncbi:MAG: type I-U CRISPR-associated protein Csb2 [Acidobacteriota bacterium]
MFAFEVEYLLGRSFAGSFRDRSEPEWPPHPARLFSALAAAYFENGEREREREREALEWLEKLGAPHIRAGSAGEPTITTAYVPTNYPGDAVPALRNKQPRSFPAQAPSEATVYFVWPEAQAAPEIAAALDELASRTGYLGKACSLVRMRVADAAPGPNYAPDPGGDQVLRVASRGRFEELKWLFAADRRPSPGAQQRYRKVDEPSGAEERGETEFERMVIFRKTAGPGLPIEATLTLTEAVRKGLMSVAGEIGQIADLIHGHNGGTHCAILGLPFVGREHADGHLVGFAVVIPRGTSAWERRSVLAACGALGEGGLHIAGIGHWVLEAVDAAPLNRTLWAVTWTRPARRWSTVTPILLDRFPKKKGPSVEEILTAACRRIGLPAPDRILHGPYSRLEGVPPVPAFRLQRKGEERPRWGVHATLAFPVAVRGPVLLGAGRYFGLGLMRPEETEDDER